MTGIKIDNNIFYENCIGSIQCQGSDRGALQMYGGSYGAQIRNNIYYNTRCPGCFIAGSGTQGSTYTLSGNRLATNPNMVNAPILSAPATAPASPNFHLTNGSVAIDAGLNLSSSGVTTDFSGNVRPVGNGYDVGAYEFSSNDSAPPAPPVNLIVQ